MKTRTRILPLIIVSGLLLFAEEINACTPPPPPTVPIAVLSVSPSETFVGNPITLNGSGSNAVCGSISEYQWDFHYNGSTFNAERNTGSNPITTYPYPSPGTYTIALRVRNTCGYNSSITSSCYHSVNVHNIIYVNKYATTGNNNGLSWTDAFLTLQDALDNAQSGAQIWVAQGTYTPSNLTIAGNPRSATFQLKNGVKLCGGFKGDSTTILSESFNNDVSDGWVIVNDSQPAGNWSALSGKMTQNIAVGPVDGGIEQPGTYAWYQNGIEWKDYHVRAKLSSSGSGAIGIIFRYKDGGNYYRFSMDTTRNKQMLIKKVNAAVTMLASNQTSRITGHIYDVEIVAEGNVLQIWVDNNLVFSVLDDSLSSGSIALYSYKDTGSTFDDIVVTDYPRDWKTYPSVLSGDLDGHDTTYPGTDNAYNVVNGSGTDATAVLDGFIITSGNANEYPYLYGGGMYNNSGSPTVKNCKFCNNHANVNGGGVYNDGGEPSFINCEFTKNIAIGSDYYKDGSGVFNYNSHAIFTRCVFTNNSGTSALCNQYCSSILVQDCIFADNLGVAIYCDNSDSTQSLSHSLSLQIENCIFTGNTSDGTGGALSCMENSSVTILNSVFFGNSASYYGGGGAIYFGYWPGGTYPSSATIKNSIFWGNSATYYGGEIYNDYSKCTMNFSNCDIEGGLTGSKVIGTVNDDGGNIGDDLDEDNPRFADAYNPAGADGIFFTDDDGLQIEPDSACVDTGTGDGTPTADILGQTRVNIPYKGQGTDSVDMGAYEVPRPIWHVKPGGTGAHGLSWEDALGTLQDALTEAVAYDGNSEIWVGKGTYKPDQGSGLTPGDRNASFHLASNVGIYGGFGGTETLRFKRDLTLYESILSGNIGTPGTNSDNSLHVVTGNGTNSFAVLDGFIIKEGNANSGALARCGSGMVNINGSPTIANCTFTLNESGNRGTLYNCNGSNPTLSNCNFISNSAGYGGAVYNDQSSPTFIRCNFVENSSELGGGVFNDSGNPIFTNCVFHNNNTDTIGGGGGIWNGNELGSPSSLILINCIFTGNKASVGGGIFNDTYSSPILKNCTFYKNQAFESGGAIYDSDSTSCVSVAINSIFWGNLANTNPEIFKESNANHTFKYCDIAGCGGSDKWDPNFGTDGGGNIDSNPHFVNPDDPAGPDKVFRTSDDGLKLQIFDPRDGDLVNRLFSCIDSADAASAPETDITGKERVDVPYIPNAGPIPETYVDIGAYESQTIWYVNINSDSGGRGWSWNTALNSLQRAIQLAAPGDEIWVASGIYQPGSHQDDEFDINKPIGIYGGFAGYEYDRNQRNIAANETILSGELGQPGPSPNNQDNIWRIVKVSANNVTIDGFMIADAFGCCPNGHAGGIEVTGKDFAIKNCVLRNNSAGYGGGVYIERVPGSVTDCVFMQNQAEAGGTIQGGSGIYVFNTDVNEVNIVGCLFLNNTSTRGTIFSEKSNTNIINCVFRENIGGAINSTDSNWTATNCLFTANHGSPTVSRGLSDEPGSMGRRYILTLNNCTFVGNSGYNNETHVALSHYLENPIGPDCYVTNCIFWNNTINITGDCYIYPDAFPVITNNLIQGGCPTINGSCQAFSCSNIISPPDPCFFDNPDFNDETVANGTQDTISVADANIYSLGDVVKIGADNRTRVVTGINRISNQVMFDPPLASDSQKSTPVANWGRYAIAQAMRSGTVYYSEIMGTARLKPRIPPTNPTINNPCIDIGSDAELALDVADLDKDGCVTEKVSLDLNGVPRQQKIKALTDSVDLGAFESGGLTSRPQTVTVTEDTPASFTLYIDPDPKTNSNPGYVIITKPKYGTLERGSGLGLTYTPDPNSEQDDKFYYKPFDGVNYGELTEVTLDMTRVEDPPIANDDVVWVNPPSGSWSSITLDVLKNDYDVDPGQTVEVYSCGDPVAPQHGTATVPVDKKTISYLPDGTFQGAGADTFSYKIKDPTSHYATASVTVKLNHAPTAYNDSAATELKIIKIIDVLANDTDSDTGQTLSIAEYSQPPSGEGQVGVYYHNQLQRQVLVFMPDTTRTDAYTTSFTYKPQDEMGLKSANPATVTVTVNNTKTIKDTDGDMLSDDDETNIFGTNPNKPDSDGDGGSDGSEIIIGSNPVNRSSGNYYADALPYVTCFGTSVATYSGYTAGQTLDKQYGWKVEQGGCNVKFKHLYSGFCDWGCMVARLNPNTIISKEFVDKGNDTSKVVRIKLYPVPGAKVEILSGQTVMAGVLFAANHKINYWDGGTYHESAVPWSSFPEYSPQGNEPPYWEHCWSMLVKFEFDFLSNPKKCTVKWDAVSNNIEDFVDVGTTEFTGLNTISKIRFASDSTEFDVRTLHVIPNDDTTFELTQPSRGEDVSQSRVPVKGSLYDRNMSGYTWYLETFPTTQIGVFINDFSESFNGDILTYWNTGAIPNGLYSLIVKLYYVDLFCLGRDENGQDLPDNEAWNFAYYFLDNFGQQVYAAYGESDPVVVSGRLKTFFNYTEEPDISVPWPGQFPFELRRSYLGGNFVYTAYSGYSHDGFLPGWVQNNQITLTEDASYWEPSEGTVFPEGQSPARDAKGLGFGYIWLQWEDGSNRLFRHMNPPASPGNDAIYQPYPDDDSGDYIQRVVTTRVDNGNTYVDTVDYTLYRADGTVITFATVNPGRSYDDYTYYDPFPGCPGDVLQRTIIKNIPVYYVKLNPPSGQIYYDQTPYPYTTWKFETVIKSKSDRFGNTLNYESIECPTCFKNKFYVNEISYQLNQNTKLAIKLDYKIFGTVNEECGEGCSACFMSPIWYNWTGANLLVIDTSSPGEPEIARDIDYWYQFTNDGCPISLEVTELGKGSDKNGNKDESTSRKIIRNYVYSWFWYDQGIPWVCKTLQMTGIFNNLWDYDYMISNPDYTVWELCELLAPSRLVEVLYHDDASYKGRRDYVDMDNYLETDYKFDFYDPTTNKFGEGQWVCETATTPYKTTYSFADANGLLRGLLTSPADGSMTKQSFYYYNGPPCKPSEVYEYWRYYDYVTNNPDLYAERLTENKYTQRTIKTSDEGQTVNVWDLTKQDVNNLADDTLFAYNENTYHQVYGLPTKQTSYQQLDQHPVDPANPQHQKLIETQLIYGNRQGNSTGLTPIEKKYLARQEVVLNDNGTPDNTTDDTIATTYYTYLENGLASTITDPNGNVTLYEYDENGYKQWTKTKKEGETISVPVERYCYDEIGQMKLKADAKGLVTRYDYDDFGNVYKERTYLDPDALNNLVRTSFTPDDYDTVGTLLSTNIYTYDMLSRRDSERTIPVQEQGMPAVSPATRRTEYTVSNKPKMVTLDSDSNPDTQDSFQYYYYNCRGLKGYDYSYDATNGNWWYTDYKYDSLGRNRFTIWWDYKDKTIDKVLSNRSHGSGKKAYDELWALNADNHWELQQMIDYKYDILDRLTDQAVTYEKNDAGYPQHNVTKYAYDGAGNKIMTTDPLGHLIYFDYDNANREVNECFAVETGTLRTGATVKKHINYYPNGLTEDITQYDYQIGILAYKHFDQDVRNRVTQVKEAIDTSQSPYNYAITTFDYKDAGQNDADFGGYSCVTIKDGENKQTRVGYNEQGQVLKTIYPYQTNHPLYEEFKYYGDGKLWKKAVWGNIPGGYKYWITYNYDALNRLYQVIYPDSGTLTYGYDGLGRNTWITDNRNSNDNVGGSHTFTYEYDPLNRLLSYTDQDGYMVRYTWHTDGQRESIEVFEPQDLLKSIYAIEYEYDLAGRLKKVSSPIIDDVRNLIVGFGYDKNGNRSQIDYFRDGTKAPSATTSMTYSYNLDNMLTYFATTGGPWFGFNATYTGYIDGLGRLKNAYEGITKSDTGQTHVTHQYQYAYDMRSQLRYAEMTNFLSIVAWIRDLYYYDNAGNVQNHTLWYDDPLPGTTYRHTSYDYDGDLTASASSSDSGDNFTLTWNDNGNLRQKTGTTNTILAYNWDNKLSSGQKGTSSIALKYDLMGNRIWRQSTVNGQTKAQKYIVDVSGGLPTILLDINTSTDGLIKKSYYYANGEVLMQNNGNHTADKYFYLHDRIGSVRQIIDQSGTVVKYYTFDPFGNIREYSGSFDNPFMFTGQWYDSEIGQYYFRARMYDPQLMRFTAFDPATGKFEEPMTLHKYLYCRNEPINRTDLTGLWDDGVRSYLSQNGYPDALTYSDVQVNSLIGGLPSNIWHGHSDMGYLQGDFDYTWADHYIPTNPYFPGTAYHFQDLSSATSGIYLSLLGHDEKRFEFAGHMGQDYFSHYAKGYRWWTGGHGWDTFVNGINPDNPYVNNDAQSRILDKSFKEANEWTKQMEEYWNLFDDPFKWIGAND